MRVCNGPIAMDAGDAFLYAHRTLMVRFFAGAHIVPLHQGRGRGVVYVEPEV